MVQLLGPSRRRAKLSTTIWSKLDDYQRDAVAYCLRKKTVGLFYEQGTGKTWITGGIVESLRSKPGVVLLVVPLANKETTWIELFKKHFDVFTSWDEFFFITGGEPTRECRFPVLILHYEAVNSIIDKLRKVDWTLVVYDESQRLKDRASLQSRTAAKLDAEYKVILSGTPIEHQPQDLYGQFRFMRPQMFGKWGDFEREWLEPVPDLLKGLRPNSMRWKKAIKVLQIIKSKRKFKKTKLPQFLAKIKPYALSLKSADVLKLPPLTMVRVPVTLRGRQRRMYDELENTMVTEIGELKIRTPTRIVQLGKLHQICGGYLIDDEGVAHEVGRAKLRETLEIIRRGPRPVVVFARYLEELRGIAENLPEEYSIDFLIGANRKRRADIQRQFQRGETDVLLAQYRAGGIGVDLFRSCTGVMHSTTYSLIDFEQAIKRLHRRGQTKAVTIYLPYAKETVDDSIYQAIYSKRSVSEAVLNYIRRRKQDASRKCGVQVHR